MTSVKVLYINAIGNMQLASDFLLHDCLGLISLSEFFTSRTTISHPFHTCYSYKTCLVAQRWDCDRQPLSWLKFMVCRIEVIIVVVFMCTVILLWQCALSVPWKIVFILVASLQMLTLVAMLHTNNTHAQYYCYVTSTDID